MIFGNKNKLALEISIKQEIDRWVYGSFILWLGGNAIGEKEDEGVDLRGCLNWLSDLVSHPNDRRCPELISKSTDEVWKVLVEPVFNVGDFPISADAFSRFHISHIGMSSFDTFVVVLIDDGISHERYIWQHNDGSLHESKVTRGSLESVAIEAISWFNRWIQTNPNRL